MSENGIIKEPNEEYNRWLTRFLASAQPHPFDMKRPFDLLPTAPAQAKGSPPHIRTKPK